MWKPNFLFGTEACVLLRAVELHVLTEDGWVSDGVARPNLFWLSSELLPKLVRWGSESRSSEFKSTLSLLPVEKYSITYQHLKEKYRAMVKVKTQRSSQMVSMFKEYSDVMSFRFGLKSQTQRSLSMRMLLLLRICW